MRSLLDHWHFLSPSGKKLIITLLGLVLLLGIMVYFLATDQKNVRDIRCLSLNIYHEARGESEEGQLGVATVTMNRVASGRYPDNVCDVVRQYGWNPRLQKHISAFSWTGDDLDNSPEDAASWRRAVAMSREVLDGKRHPELETALFYHADYVNPSWAKRKKLLKKIDSHLFYP